MVGLLQAGEDPRVEGHHIRLADCLAEVESHSDWGRGWARDVLQLVPFLDGQEFQISVLLESSNFPPLAVILQNLLYDLAVRKVDVQGFEVFEMVHNLKMHSSAATHACC